MSESINVYRVRDLNAKIKEQIENLKFVNIVVVGELASFKKSGPHVFFKLLDKDKTSIDCAFFYISDENLNRFKDGDNVLLTGKLDYYIPYGKLSFIANKIEFNGEGELKRKLLELKNKLDKEGYFDPKYKKPIPKFLNNICVITSKDGAVIRDIHKSIRKKNNNISIYLYDVRVQGIDCASSIINALNFLDDKGYDVILIARGGGSTEDLMGFNDENLVKAIFKSKTPIVSAIGHEIDVTLCDFVADKSYLTPTAAGEGLAYNSEEIINYMNDVLKSCREKLLQKYNQSSNDISKNINFNIRQINYLLNNTKLKIENKLKNFKMLSNRIARECQQVINYLQITVKETKNNYKKINERFIYLNKNIESLNPDKLLNKGYFRIMDVNNRSLMNFDNIKVNDELKIISKDKIAKAIIKEVQNEK